MTVLLYKFKTVIFLAKGEIRGCSHTLLTHKALYLFNGVKYISPHLQRKQRALVTELLYQPFNLQQRTMHGSWHRQVQRQNITIDTA